MTPEVRELVTWGLGTALTSLTLIGVAIRFALLPYIQEHVAQPVGVVRDQVANDHNSNLRDDVDVLDGKLDQIIVSVARLETTVSIHVAASDQANRDQWSAIDRLKGR